MDIKKRIKKNLIFSTIIIVIIIVSLFTNFICFKSIIMIGRANPGNIMDSWYNSTKLNLSVLEIPPRINWYDFQYNQSGVWVSKLNSQIDVNNSAEYRFVVSISSDQGWADIEYVNITAWYDQGSESTKYNETLGGNLNLFLQYENKTGIAVWKLMWPNYEVIEGTYSEVIGYDPYGSLLYTQCHNLTFSFIPGYQFRYTPGDGIWDNTYNTTNDAQSWNFIINADDGEYNSSIMDEFGVYSYSKIISAGSPTIIGSPGENKTANSNISLITCSNGNYSLSVDIGNLLHKNHPTAYISKEQVWVRGGDLDNFDNFTTVDIVVYLYGSAGLYHIAEPNGTNLTTNDVQYKCDIPIGQMAGDYTSSIWYHLITN